jgi:hypothetical protein
LCFSLLFERHLSFHRFLRHLQAALGWPSLAFQALLGQSARAFFQCGGQRTPQPVFDPAIEMPP